MLSAHKKAPTFWQVVQSVLAALFGVQSSKARERDFTQGKPWMYIVLGLIAVILFVLFLCGIVYLVLSLTKVR